MIEKKPRPRGTFYPYEIVLRLTPEMGERLDAEAANGKTKVSIIRDALDKYLPKRKKAQEK